MNRTHRHLSWIGDLLPKTFSAAFAIGLGLCGFAYSLNVLDRLPAVSVIAQSRAEPRTIESATVPVPPKPASTAIDARESVDDWSCRAGC